MKRALMKFMCIDCEKEFIVQKPPLSEKRMCCPFCKGKVEAVVAGNKDDQDLYEEMGCLYPGRGRTPLDDLRKWVKEVQK